MMSRGPDTLGYAILPEEVMEAHLSKEVVEGINKARKSGVISGDDRKIFPGGFVGLEGIDGH